MGLEQLRLEGRVIHQLLAGEQGADVDPAARAIRSRELPLQRVFEPVKQNRAGLDDRASRGGHRFADPLWLIGDDLGSDENVAGGLLRRVLAEGDADHEQSSRLPDVEGGLGRKDGRIASKRAHGAAGEGDIDSTESPEEVRLLTDGNFEDSGFVSRRLEPAQDCV